MSEKQQPEPRSQTTTGIEAIVRKWKSERIFASSDAMEELECSLGFRILTELLAEARENAMRKLVIGPTLDQADYTRALGMLAGLQSVQEIPGAIRKIAAHKQEQLERRSEPAAAGGE